MPPPPPPPIYLPEPAIKQELQASIQSSKDNSKERTVKLVTAHLEQAVRQHDTSGVDFTLHCQEIVRRLVATLDLSFMAESVKDNRDEHNDEDGYNGEEPIIISFYRYVSPCIQKGPSCGLAALCMALNLFDQSCDSGDILHAAQEFNFTKQGEMFSAENLLTLACHLSQCNGRLLDKNENIRVKEKQIVDELMRNNIVLIPYDRDGNSEPCLKSGHKAHWACLTGIVFVKDYTSRKYLTKSDLCSITPDSQITSLFHTNSPEKIWQSDLVLQPRTTFVYAMHGRSIHARLWCLDSVLASNAQLTSLDPYIVENIQDYSVPADGFECGLSGQVIVLSPNNTKIIQNNK